MTGLPNRALFLDRLSHAIEREQRGTQHAFAVLFVDFDRFKVINDSLGHAAGDTLLIALARKLSRCLRSGDTVARFGGDEFAILLEDIDGTNDASRVAERIHQQLLKPVKLQKREIYVSASIGIVSSETGYVGAEDVLRNADIAMYRAKALGKASYQVFHPAMRARAQALLELEAELRTAIERQQLRLRYQPIVTLQNHQIVGFEALVRWHHPQHGLIPPHEFVPIAEETGLIVAIDRWVMCEACRQLKRWQVQYSMPVTLSVNMSAQDFTRPDLTQYVETVLKETEFEPSRLSLEIKA